MFSDDFLIGLDLITLGGLLNLTVLSIVWSVFVCVLSFYRGSDVFNAYGASICSGEGERKKRVWDLKYNFKNVR